MKTLTMYRPNTIQNALNGFEKYFDSFFGDSFLAPAAALINQMPAVDIRENENSYVLDMELPGFDEKNIEIHIDGSNLTIASRQEKKIEETNEPAEKGTQEIHNGNNQGTYLLRERRTSSFTRSFKLPENANPEAASAEFKNGILRLEIKKRAEALKRAIQINAA